MTPEAFIVSSFICLLLLTAITPVYGTVYGTVYVSVGLLVVLSFLNVQLFQCLPQYKKKIKYCVQ